MEGPLPPQRNARSWPHPRPTKLPIVVSWAMRRTKRSTSWKMTKKLAPLPLPVDQQAKGGHLPDPPLLSFAQDLASPPLGLDFELNPARSIGMTILSRSTTQMRRWRLSRSMRPSLIM
jgi:hypothetical protein